MIRVYATLAADVVRQFAVGFMASYGAVAAVYFAAVTP